MTKPRPRWTLRLASVAVFGLLAHVGCATGTNGSPSDDFCGALSDAASRCASSAGATGGTNCDQTMAASCSQLASNLNPTVLAAAKDCLATASCSGSPVGACLPSAVNGAQPTEAQKQLAADYCKTCTLGAGSTCIDAFYSQNGKASAFGKLLLPFGDGPVKEIDSTCASTPGCGATFTTCAGAILAKALGTSLSKETVDCTLASFGGDGAGGGGGGGDDGGAGGGDDAGPPHCDTNTCAGCCDANGVCQQGDDTTACGHGGKTCAVCDSGKACNSGACIDPSCKASCAGCCGPTGCMPGNTTSACGASGDACTVCGAGRTCSGGCKVDPNALWNIVAVRGEFAATKRDGSAWDPFNGAPDPYLKITVQNHAGQTDNGSNTYTPTWNQTVITGAKALEIKTSFHVQAIDSDPIGDDNMGSCNATITDAMFDQQLQTISCAPSGTDGTAFKVYLKFVIP